MLPPALQVKVNALVGSMPDGALQVEGGVVEEVRQPPYVQGAFQIFDVSVAAMPYRRNCRLLPAAAAGDPAVCLLNTADSLPAPAAVRSSQQLPLASSATWPAGQLCVPADTCDALLQFSPGSGCRPYHLLFRFR